MKKILATMSAMLMLFACAELEGPDKGQNNDNSGSGDPAPAAKDVSFNASLGSLSKVAIQSGDFSWNQGDRISVFSVAADADPGMSLEANYVYHATSAGASAEFVNSSLDFKVSVADKYYAYIPQMESYPSNLNPNDAVGFIGAVANQDDINDYRYMPVTVNGSETVYYDASTHKAYGKNNPPHFYAEADGAGAATSPVNLTFKPILPMIELVLTGDEGSTLKAMTIAYADKSTDVLDEENGEWLTGKGVFDMSTGVLTTTNTSSSAYCKLNVTFETSDALNYITLSEETPVTIPLTVGPFAVTKGLTITFTDNEDKTIEKTIWADQAYNGVSDDGQCKFFSEEIFVSDKIRLDGSSYYEVSMSDVDWTKSYVQYVKDADGYTIAALTKEFFGATVNKQGIVAYPAPGTVLNYTTGSVVEVTLDGDAAPTEDVHGGSVSAWTTTAANVVYTAGATAANAKFYVKSDGTEITFETPAEGTTVKAATLEPYTLTSTSGEVHPLVKIGDRFWTATCYKTKKTATDNVEIPQVQTAPDSYTRALYIDSETNTWLYNGVPLSVNKDGTTFTNKIAPSGWTLPSVSDWTTDLSNFLGGTTAYVNMKKALLYKENSYAFKVGQSFATLGYFSTWSCDENGSGSKLNMLLCKENTAPAKSAQAYKVMFEVRLVSVSKK